MPSAVAFRTVNSAAVALAAATVQTCLSVIAPAGHGLAMTEFSVTFDGVTNSAIPALVEICQSTQAGAGTSGQAVTPVQVRGRSSAGQAPTAGAAFGATPPSVLTAVWADFVPVFNGFVSISFTDGHEIECDSSAGTIKALVIRITAPAVVNVRCEIETANL